MFKLQVDIVDLEKMLVCVNEYIDGVISNFECCLDKMDKCFNCMVVMSSVQIVMVMNIVGLVIYNCLGVGVGYSEGELVMVVGYQCVLNEKGLVIFSFNGVFINSGECSMGVGVGIGW